MPRMHRLLAPAVLVFGLLAACGQSEDPAPPADVGGLPATAQGPGVFEVGADIASGTYVADVESEFSCFALAATTADLDLEADTPDVDLPPAAFLGDQLRIELAEGTFFHVLECDVRWNRLTDAEAAATDPGTVEGACSILTADLVEQVLSFPDERDPRREGAQLQSLQSVLFAVVLADVEDDSGLSDPAGQLIDYLDDPEAYVTDGRPADDAAAAADAIRTTCDH